MKIESAVLKRLGPIPFWRGEKKCLDELNRIYRKAKMFAQEALENTSVSASEWREHGLQLPNSSHR